MKKISSIVSVLIVIAAIYWGFADLKPSLSKEETKVNTDFSLQNALNHLQKITQNTHFVGSQEHKKVQDYIVSEFEKLGLETGTIRSIINYRTKGGQFRKKEDFKKIMNRIAIACFLKFRIPIAFQS